MLPDISLFAGANRQYPATWALCSDSQVGQSDHTFTDCAPATAGGTYSIEGAGGTGTAAAAFSGVLAMVIQSLQTASTSGGPVRLGVANNVLYNLYATSSNSGGAIFHDVTEGNNSVPCTAGSPDCGANGFLSGYNAGAGYDLASGLGSVDIGALITAWPTAAFATTTTTLTANNSASPINVTHGTPVTLAATVSSATGTPTGSVSVPGLTGMGGLDANESISLAGGAGSISPDNLPGGSYSIQAYYPGDVTHGPSTSNPPIMITVSPEASQLQVSLQVTDVTTSQPLPNPNSFEYGSFGYFYVQPVSATAGQDGVATGSVTLLNGTASMGSQVLNSMGRAAFQLDALAPGVYNLGASYGGDPSFGPSSTSTPTQITIAKRSTQLSAAAASPNLAYSASATVTVTLATDSTGAFPGGTITLTAGGQSFPGTTVQTRTPVNSDQETATFTVPGSALVNGANTLTATYPGDGNYDGSTATVVLNVTGAPAPAFTLAGPTGGITASSPSVSASGLVTVTPTNGFAGAVSLACSVTGAPGGAMPACTLTPSSVTLASNTPATATLTIGATAAATASLIGPRHGGPADPDARGLLARGGELALGSLLLFALPGRRRFRRALYAAAMLLGTMGVLGMAGCGVHPATNQTNSYMVTVTGTSGSTVASTQIAVTVQ